MHDSERDRKVDSFKVGESFLDVNGNECGAGNIHLFIENLGL
jgi:hypothetical protein